MQAKFSTGQPSQQATFLDPRPVFEAHGREADQAFFHFGDNVDVPTLSPLVFVITQFSWQILQQLQTPPCHLRQQTPQPCCRQLPFLSRVWALILVSWYFINHFTFIRLCLKAVPASFVPFWTQQTKQCQTNQGCKVMPTNSSMITSPSSTKTRKDGTLYLLAK